MTGVPDFVPQVLEESPMTLEECNAFRDLVNTHLSIVASGLVMEGADDESKALAAEEDFALFAMKCARASLIVREALKRYLDYRIAWIDEALA